LSPARREALILDELRARVEPIRPMHEGPLALLRYCRHPWSEPFTREVLRALRDEALANGDAFPVLGSLLASMAQYMDPSVAPDRDLELVARHRLVAGGLALLQQRLEADQVVVDLVLRIAAEQRGHRVADRARGRVVRDADGDPRAALHLVEAHHTGVLHRPA